MGRLFLIRPGTARDVAQRSIAAGRGWRALRLAA